MRSTTISPTWKSALLRASEILRFKKTTAAQSPAFHNAGSVSYLSNGPLLEMNSIICSEFKETDNEFGDGGAVGIFTEDYVDQDDLYPYVPEKRIPQDATVVAQVRSHLR
ncbi:hypothetical protein PF010_g25310 [Phytophthora fragariae]|uniref:Uncharacterized protein n=1 Tax=Phytophthora fragariae TaxID=53985 RepID=A0A6G0K112_9STRA|nr:hypothetical protein PF010_g25310 [Phytophthora fragariae]